MMKICVLGTGYVGLVAGTCFAETGNDVVCVDLNPEKIANLNKGILPIYEPGLKELVDRNAKEGRLKFTTNGPESIAASEIIFIAVGTPSSEDGSADLDLFLKAAGSIAENMKDYKIIVNKSTVPVGTAAKVEAIIRAKTKQDFDVVSNPEFLKEGTAVSDFLKPDRVIIGTSKEKVYKTMCDLYAPFVLQGNPIIGMSNVSAEMAKYAANAFLATKISFMNNIATLCEKVGADVESVRTGIASDQRIGRHFLYAGAGYGGSCFPKDVKALIKVGRDNGIDMEIVQAAENVNERQKSVIFEKITKKFGKDLKGRVFGFWGLSFKPNTDDMREAPSLVVIESLVNAGATVRAYDPVAIREAKHALSEMDHEASRMGRFEKTVTFHENNYAVLDGCDALVLMTEWGEFRTPDFKRIKSSLKTPIIFDGRNIYEPQVITAQGFEYFGIGRNVST